MIMKQKKYFILAAAALAFAACSNDEIVSEEQVQQTVVDDGSVKFDVYVSRGTTRAGANGALETSNIKDTGDDHGIAGFGVFGYYTDGEPYAGNTKPNFFYNQQVTYDGSKWTYSPIKYWPNEFGSDAVSDEVDRVSLFAYAPWVAVDGLTGLVTDNKDENIVSMTRNTANGDPFVKYVASMNAANSVDLCYGVAAEAFTSSNSTANTNNIEAGKPFVDLKKPATDAGSKIKWNFKHALAQLRVTLDAKVTNLTNGATDVDENTRIWVRSITFTGVTQKGSLNLHDGKWYDVNGVNQITTGSITVYDGRKDGREANDAASNETPATFNSKFVQTTQYTVADGTYNITAPATTQGVNATTANLFESAVSTNPIFVIPTNEDMEVTIVYDVETADKNLSSVLSDGQTKGSTIENTISKKLTTLGHIQAGKCYTLALHLGMRSVDFEAEVTDWVPYVAPVDLPSNAPAYASKADPSASLGSVTVPASAISYVYQITDLPATTIVSHAESNGTSPHDMGTPTASVTDGAGTPNQSSSTGVTYVTFTAAANTTTSTKTCDVQIGCGGRGGKLTINQQAHELGLAFSASTTTTTITVTTSPSLSPAVSDLSAGGAITVYDLTADPSCSTNLYSSVSSLTITTSSALISGHTYKVTVTNNDVTESITFIK